MAELKNQGLTLAEILELLLEDLHRARVHRASHRGARRTMLRKQQRIAQLLLDRLGPAHAAGAAPIWSSMRTEITSAWQTEDHPRERLTVADEREHVLFYLAEILYRIVPAFYEEIAEALEKVYGVQPGVARAAGDAALRLLGRRRHGRQPGRSRQDHPRNARAPAAADHQRLLQGVPAAGAAALAERQPQRGLRRSSASASSYT